MNRDAPLIPEAVVADWRKRVAQLTDELVPDTNHYTLMLGARGAELIASRARQPTAGRAAS